MVQVSEEAVRRWSQVVFIVTGLEKSRHGQHSFGKAAAPIMAAGDIV